MKNWKAKTFEFQEKGWKNAEIALFYHNCEEKRAEPHQSALPLGEKNQN